MPPATPGTVPRWRRPARILLWASLTLIGLLVLVLGILPSLVSLESARQQLLERAEAALHRKVDIGAIHLQIWTGLGLGLDDLTVYNPSGWQQPYMLKVSRVSAKVAALPLLRGQVAISKFVVSTGDLFLERDPTGRLNIGDLLEARPEADQPQAARSQTTPSPGDPSGRPSPLSSLQVADMSFQHVNATFLDQMLAPGRTVTTTLGDLRGDLRNIALQTPIEFKMAGTLLTDTNRNIQIQGRIGPIPVDGSFDSAPLDAHVQVRDVLLDKLGPYLAAG
ncbi:MAG: AsmA family protein, partial [Candidatus Entotheonellia bacterium]